MKAQIKLFGLTFLLITSVISCSFSKEDTGPSTLKAKLGDEYLTFKKIIDLKDKSQIKWGTKDGKIIYTSHGRIVKTEKFKDGNLLFSYSNETDPLSIGLHKEKTGLTYKRLVDWTEEQTGIELSSEFQHKGKKSLSMGSEEIDVLLVLEKVTIPSLSISYSNRHWINSKTGKIIKSIQHFNPKQKPLNFYFEK